VQAAITPVRSKSRSAGRRSGKPASRALFEPLRIAATAQVHILLDFTINFHPRRIAMKQATFFALLFVIATALAVPSARAQATNDKQLNAGLDSGTNCMPYRVDVPTLVDNDYRIFWKQADCIVIHITNNPFRLHDCYRRVG
jgi:hypothetical protein